MPFCQLRQFRISSALDDSRPIPPALQKHVEACPRCSRFLKDSQALAENLTPAPSAETPAWLHTKIMSEVRAATPAAPVTGRRWLPALAGAAAIGLAVAVIGSGVHEPDRPEPEATTVQISAPVTPLHPASFSSRFEEHAKQTLSREFQNLAADISGARNFLAASFRNTIPGLGDE